MMLLPKKIRKLLPPLDSTKDADDPVALVKLYATRRDITWYIIEFDGYDVAYGYTVWMGKPKLCQFNMSELESMCGPFRLGVKRDKTFQPTLLSMLKSK